MDPVEPDLTEYEALLREWRLSPAAEECARGLQWILWFSTLDGACEDDEGNEIEDDQAHIAPEDIRVPDALWDLCEQVGVEGLVDGRPFSGSRVAQIVVRAVI